MKIEEKKVNVYKMLILFGILIHCVFQIIFSLLSHYAMSGYNAFVAAIFLYSFYFLRQKKKHVEINIILCFVASTLFVLLSLYFFGWDQEFQNWLMTFVTISFLLPLYEKRKWFKAIGIINFVLYPICYSFQLDRDAVPLPVWAHNAFLFTNIIFPFLMIMYLSKILNINKAVEEHLLREIKRMAHFDTLTGLYNRRKMDEIIAEIEDEIRAKGASYYVAFVDVDDFKRINDTYGHDVGDKVLARTAKAIKQALSGDDFIARWGGEEFLILLKEEAEDPRLALERISQSIRDIEIDSYPDIRITATIGVAAAKEQEDINAAIQKADENMYIGKRSGKNRVVF